MLLVFVPIKLKPTGQQLDWVDPSLPTPAAEELRWRVVSAGKATVSTDPQTHWAASRLGEPIPASRSRGGAPLVKLQQCVHVRNDSTDQLVPAEYVASKMELYSLSRHQTTARAFLLQGVGGAVIVQPLLRRRCLLGRKARRAAGRRCRGGRRRRGNAGGAGGQLRLVGARQLPRQPDAVPRSVKITRNLLTRKTIICALRY